MTTDLSQLHPEQEFPRAETERAPSYLVYKVALLGLGLLGASGYAAYTTLANQAPEPPSNAWLTTPLAEDDPGEEADRVADLVFGESDAPGADAEPPAARAKGTTELPVTRKPAPGSGPPPAASDAGDPPEADSDTGDLGPAAVSPTAGEGAYYIQVASYRTKERADQHAGELSSRGLAAQSVAYGGPEAGWWHSVRMGPFDKRVEAETRRFDLQKHERQSAYVLPRANGKFHVQVASFSEREEAEQVAKRFRAQGHATKVTRVRMSGRYWHCVRIGPFDTREEALGYRALVIDIPGSQSTVIPFGPPAGS